MSNLDKMRTAGRALPTNDEAMQLRSLCDELEELRDKLKLLEEDAAKVQETIDGLSFGKIPSLMETLGLASITLADGRKVAIKEKYFASISNKDPEKKERALAWLRDHEFGFLVGNKVSVGFKKGSEEEQEKLKQLLTNHDYGWKEDESVHASTLRAFVKEQTEAGVSLPHDLLNISIRNETEIK